MQYGLRKSLEDIAVELKGIKTILGSMWHSRYKTEETDRMNPELYADEYISTEECAKRLNVSDQTIRNWISKSKQNKGQGWVEGIHYINICPRASGKAVIRIPWHELVRSFAKDRPVEPSDLRNRTMYNNSISAHL
jgi:hypothetical protein